MAQADMEANKETGKRSIGVQAASLLSQAAATFSQKAFSPHRVFRGGHAQTIAAYAWPRPYRFHSPPDEERLFPVDPTTKVLARCRWQDDRSLKPTLILWHGIEGSTASVYMIATADKAFRAGFNVVRVNLRSCGGTEKLGPTFYHGGLSGDLRAVIDQLILQDKLTTVFAIGYSLGGNMVLKLAAEYGENPPPELLSVCAVSPSVNLRASSDLICRRSNWIYHRDFVRRLRQRVLVNQKLYPDVYDLTKIEMVHTLRDFDEHYTARVHGFSGADDYYQKSSSIHIIDRIKLPTLIIHAQDDPFIPFAPLRNPKLLSNPHILLLDPKHGGHVAFISAKKNSDEDRFWAENRVVEFCCLAAESHLRD
jgi:predicted alpha/beta-fold hydrolase